MLAYQWRRTSRRGVAIGEAERQVRQLHFAGHRVVLLDDHVNAPRSRLRSIEVLNSAGRPAPALEISAVFLPPAVAPTFFGVWLVRRVESDRFYAIAYGLTFVVGLYLV